MQKFCTGPVDLMDGAKLAAHKAHRFNNKNKQKRTIDVLRKPDIFRCY
jgi:hypothetical protein